MDGLIGSSALKPTRKIIKKVLDKPEHRCYNKYRKKEREENKMTKRELMEMVEKFNDNDEILFVTRNYDRDGYPEDVTRDIYKIVKKGTPKKGQMYVTEE